MNTYHTVYRTISNLLTSNFYCAKFVRKVSAKCRFIDSGYRYNFKKFGQLNSTKLTLLILNLKNEIFSKLDAFGFLI